jgi:hypothetical protein
LKIQAPIYGLHRGLPANEPPEGTSFDIMNCRPFDTTSERIRLGQRPGTTKAYTTQVSGASHPVLYMDSIVTTYIEPS